MRFSIVQNGAVWAVRDLSTGKTYGDPVETPAQACSLLQQAVALDEITRRSTCQRGQCSI